jgi:hypothetical protein
MGEMFGENRDLPFHRSGITKRTIGADGNDEPRDRHICETVDYLLIARISLRLDQVFDFETKENVLKRKLAETLECPVKWSSIGTIE